MKIKKTATRTDSYRHKGLRRRLVQVLKKKGIKNQAVLKAIEAVPRHFMLDSIFADKAYEDRAFPIDNEQTISQPYTVAYMTELLQVKPALKVLEIGTGSGYQAAVLAKLNAEVHTIERHQHLSQKASKILPEMGIHGVHFYFGDGTEGLASQAPFDRIIVTAGAPVVPDSLLQQLKIGGILVIPVGDAHQVMRRYIKTSEQEFEIENHGDFRFVPFLEGVKPKN